MAKSNGQIVGGMVILLLIVAWVGITGLYADELYIDEAMSAMHVSYEGWHNPLEVVQSLQRNSPDHVPGYFTILMIWARLTAFDPGILRYFSVVFAMLALAMTYRLATSLHSPTAGLLTSALIALSGLFLYYTHELRMYTLQMTLIAFEAWLYWKIINSKTSPKWYHWLGLTLGAILLMYTHYFSIFVLASLGLYHFLFVKKDRRWLGVAISMAIAGTSLLPWLWIQREALANQYTLDGAITSLQLIEFTGFLFTNGVPLLLLLVIPGIVLGIRQRDKRVVFVLTIAIGALVVMVLFHEFGSHLVAYRRARYVLVLFPYIALTFGLSLVWLKRWRWLIPLFLIVWGGTAGLFLSSSDLPELTNRIDDLDVRWYPPIDTIAEQLENLATADTPIWLVRLDDAQTPFKVPDRVWLFYSDWSSLPIRYLRDAHFETDLRASQLSETATGIWFVHNPTADYPHIESFLDKTFIACESALEYDDYHIRYYVGDLKQCHILDITSN